MQKEDKLIIGGHEFHSRFILGSGKYSLKLIEAAVKDAGAEIITLAVRRANTKDQENILDFIPKNVTLLPNTSGARNAEEAVEAADPAAVDPATVAEEALEAQAEVPQDAQPAAGESERL